MRLLHARQQVCIIPIKHSNAMGYRGLCVAGNYIQAKLGGVKKIGKSLLLTGDNKATHAEVRAPRPCCAHHPVTPILTLHM